MGSFTELTLAFAFTPDAPPEIIGAFAEWRTGEDGPPLPTLEESLGAEEVGRLDLHFSDYITDELVRPLPPLQRAVAWRALLQWSSNSYFPGTPSCELVWDPYGTRWTLSLRALPKMGGEEIESLVASLGEFAADGSAEYPWFAGYVNDETIPRPTLVWSTGAAPFRFEALDVVS